MSREKNCFFPEAVTYPDFFNHNLNDQNRVLKVVSGRYCWARAFYYQLMKVIFEFESDQQNSTDYGQLLISICRKAIQKSPKSLTDQKIGSYIPLLINFLQSVSQNQDTNFQQYINTHKQVDQALTTILTLIIQESDINISMNSEQKIKYLGQVFQEIMLQFENGLKFQQSDTFLYFQAEDKIYIAFLNYVSEFEEYQGDQGDQGEDSKEDGVSIDQYQDKGKDKNQGNGEDGIERDKFVSRNQKNVNNQQAQQSEVNQYVTTSIIPIRETVEAAITTILDKQQQKSPVEYLFTNKFRSNSNSMRPSTPPNINNFPRNSPDQIKSPLQDHKQISIVGAAGNRQLNENMEFTLGKKKVNVQEKAVQKSEQSFKILNRMQVRHAETLDDIKDISDADFKYKTRTSNVVERKFFDYPTSTFNKQQEQLIYKPISNRNLLNQVNSQPPKKDPLDVCNDSEKGTFYRKFTDTRILNLLSEPYRTKVKMLKNRFIGVHSRGYRSPVYQQQF